jgi:hypothetical protein
MSRPANTLVVSHTRRGVTAKGTGAVAQALFDAMLARYDSSVALPRPGPHTVHFVDMGQDFLEWDIDARGVVTDCRPCQAWAWRGCVLVTDAKPGEQLRYMGGDGVVHSIRYPVARIVARVALLPDAEPPAGGVAAAGTGGG